MCIFTSTAGVNVSGTSIFGRLDGDEQLLGYQMTFGAASDVAMVLPLPIAAGHGAAAVRFIDLSGFPSFFESLVLLFPQFLALSGGMEQIASRSQGVIEVQR